MSGIAGRKTQSCNLKSGLIYKFLKSICAEDSFNNLKATFEISGQSMLERVKTKLQKKSVGFEYLMVIKITFEQFNNTSFIFANQFFYSRTRKIDFD